MNILFFLKQFPLYGGVERITITLASALQQRGYNVYIMSERGEAEELLADLDEDVTYLYFPSHTYISKENVNYFMSIVHNFEIRYIINQGCYPEVNRFLNKCRDRHNAKVISVLHNDPLAGFQSLIQIRISKDWKSIVKRMVWPVYKLWVYWLVIGNFRQVVSFSSRIVLLSDSFQDNFCRYSGLTNKNKLVTIPNCFEFADIKISELNKAKIILYVGRVVEEQKRLSRLFEIWNILSKRHIDWKLQIVGDGEKMNDYKKYVENNKIPRVFFEGYQKDVSTYMQQASFLSLVSDYEGFPMVIVEAMHNRCIPVVYGSYSAVYDIIDNGVSGIIVPPFNQEIYINELEKLMNNVEQSKKMADKAYEKTTCYSIERILPLWEELLNSENKI